MYSKVWIECPHCGFEIENEFDVGEHFMEPCEECPECGKKIDADLADAEEQAISSLTDAAMAQID